MRGPQHNRPSATPSPCSAAQMYALEDCAHGQTVGQHGATATNVGREEEEVCGALSAGGSRG